VSKRDPLLFLLFSAITVALTGFIEGALFPICMIVLSLALCVKEGLFQRVIFWKSMGYFIFFAVSSAWIYGLAPAPGATASPWWTGLLVGLRIMAAGTVSLLFAMTVDRAALCRALVFRAGIPRRFVYGIVAAIASAPLLAEEWAIARQIARSVDRGWKRILPSPGVLILLLAGLIRRSGDIAIALEMRGATSALTTPWRVPQARHVDWIWLVAGFAFLFVTAVASIAWG
jgi:energy-coupling factor transporter transmembrane protein EcfT